MDSKMKKTVRIKSEEDEGKDRISELPDELIHKIMFCLDDTKLAVQTSILSNRWKLIWKTLPFLTFTWHSSETQDIYCNLVAHVFSHRNHHSGILTLDLFRNAMPTDALLKCLEYGFSHNVQELSVCTEYCDLALSVFRSHSLQKLKWFADFEQEVMLGENHSWDLPALTTLELVHINDVCYRKFLESCLICMPALTSLLLHSFELPNSLSLPALVSLELVDIVSPNNWSDFFSAFVSLQNLTWTFPLDTYENCFISCPQLLNLKIRTLRRYSDTDFPTSVANIVVSSPKLRNFDSVGIFTITCVVSSLETVNIKLHGCFYDKTEISSRKLKRYYQCLTIMFPGLGGAKILTLDSETLEIHPDVDYQTGVDNIEQLFKALSEVSDLLGHFPSPFYNLKYVKLPQGYKESSLSSITKSYLLGGSPEATIVTTFPQVPVSLTARNVVFEETSATSTKELVDLQDIPKKPHVDSNCGLWRGFEVNTEFVDLLDLITKKYPETFEDFATESKKLCAMKLNMLCTSVNDFRKFSITEVSREMIAEYRLLFAELQRSFNVKWLVSRLNYIEQLHYPSPLLKELHAINSHIDDAKSNVKDLQTRFDDAQRKLKDLKILREEMMTAIKGSFKYMDPVLAASAGCIGDDLFSGY